MDSFGVVLLSIALLGPAWVQAQTPASSGPRGNSDGAVKQPKPLFGRNLLVNGDAEAEVQDKEVPGWGDPQDGFTTPAYGSQGGEWDWGVSGCPGCGKQYFHLMWEGEAGERSFSQTVAVTGGAKIVDGGRVGVRLSGYFGGYRESDTTEYLVAEFQDENGQALGSLVTRPVDTKALPPVSVGNTSLMPVEAKGKLPAGTRRIVVTFHGKATGSSGSYLALGDNLSLVLTPGE